MILSNKTIYLKLLLIALFFVWGQGVQAQENRTVMEYVIQERPILAGLLTKAGLTPMLSGQPHVTLFAPPESALQALSKESPERLRAILASHILKGTYLEKDLKDGKSLQSACSTRINIYRKDNQTLVNGVRIERPDLKAENGVVHELGGMFRM